MNWITPHEVYLALGSNKDARVANYRELFCSNIAADLINEIRTATNGNYTLGNQRFKSDIEQMLKRRTIPGKPGRPSRVD